MAFLLQPPSSRIHLRDDNHAGYVTPPLDGSLTVSELYDFHYENNPNHPVFVFANSAGLTHLTFQEVVPAAYNAARFVGKAVGIDLQDPNHPRPTIGVLATTDTITCFTTVLGMLRAEIIPFVISPRNSPAALVHLLAKSHVSHLFVSGEPAIKELARTALRGLDHNDVQMCRMPTHEDIFNSHSEFSSLPPVRKDYSVPRLIVHSSGSTSFPKPIAWNDRLQLQASLMPLFGKHDLLSKVFGCHALAMHHGIGLCFIFWLASTGLVMATFPPVSPTVIPTPEAAWNGFLATNPSYIFGPPVFFEGWSRDSSKLSFFKESKGLIFGGAPLSKAVGDYLAREGVAIYILCGASETGPYSYVFPDHPGLDWEYFYINPQCAVEFVALGDGTYELVAVARATTELAVLNTTFKGEPAYASSDLVAPHPTEPGKWKILGRLDDQITLSTGEKTNPGPLEAILGQHPHISSLVMFGRGKFQIGVLIEIKNKHYFDPQDVDKLKAFRNTMQPYMEAMNATAPTHSRLFKEMIIVASSSKPFLFNAKGSPRRSVILSNYSAEIEGLYADLEKGSNTTAPLEWTAETLLDFIRSVVNEVLKTPAEDNEDIFDKGCDSLQAMWIRQKILQAVRSTTKTDLPSSFIYEHPTIWSLANHIISKSNPHNPDKQDLNNGVVRREDLKSFLAPYIANFPAHRGVEGAKSGSFDVVLITGTTGALGTAVLAKLVACDSVERIYALNRSSENVGILQRQEEALASRGYDPKIAKSAKVTLVEGDLTKDGLIIGPALLEEMRAAVTHIFHIAWRVDFNLSLISFRKVIDGVRSLVDLALSSPKAAPPRLLFASSVGIFRNNIPEEPIPEVPIEDPSVPLGNGYAESKWVAEHILYEAAKTTALRPIVVRLGQVSGGINGCWNSSDWMPAIVKSSLKMGFLPDIRGTASWVPLDFAAETFLELRSANIPSATAHLVHPRPVSSHDVFSTIGEILKLPLRPYVSWVETLEGLAQSSTADLSSIPAAKILGFYRDVVLKESDTRDAMAVPNLDFRQTLAASPAFRAGSVTRLVPEEIDKWLCYWQSTGFLPSI